jgi:hypothetical protein
MAVFSLRSEISDSNSVLEYFIGDEASYSVLPDLRGIFVRRNLGKEISEILKTPELTGTLNVTILTPKHVSTLIGKLFPDDLQKRKPYSWSDKLRVGLSFFGLR